MALQMLQNSIINVELKEMVHIAIKVNNKQRRSGNMCLGKTSSTCTWRLNHWRKHDKQPIVKPKVEQTMEDKVCLILSFPKIDVLNVSSVKSGVIYLANL